MSKATVFISYSHKDKDWVRDYLLTNLEKNGITCHIDFRDFAKGIPSSVNMERAIESTTKTILVFTQNWFESENTQLEAAMLQVLDPIGEKGKVVPILREEVEIPLRFKIYTHYDFTAKINSASVLDELISDLKKIDTSQEKEEKNYPLLDVANIDISRLPQTGFELFGRQKELTLLNKAWETDITNIVSFVAYGGVGKSTLINKWVEKLRWENYRGAEKVFAWSFYSQGTSERVTSAEMFINHALGWFGDTDPTQGSAWDKGKRLAGLINAQKTLLILDGMEPLQTAEKVEQGKIKDPALRMLITELAKKNKGLCLITTREHVPELDRYPKRAQQENLEHISNEAGRKLLETRRILGSKKELEAIVQQFGNHALAINLLAEYLRLFKNHPLEEAKNIPDLAIPEEKGKHARRVIEAFSKRFGSASAEVQLLSILGLFDRPVPLDAIKSIIGNSPIPSFPDKITDTTGSAWLTILKNLRKHKLIFKDSEHQTDSLDCHPLLREHFGDKLQIQNPDAWKAAHERLYDYYKNLPKKELPDTLKEMGPLFSAIAHGCLAGKHQEALSDVYWNRICRRDEQYISRKLGAVASALSCLTSFFETLWDLPVSALPENSKGAALGWASFMLRAVGRSSEAVQPAKACLDLYTKQEKWDDLALESSNLSELYLTLGEVESAVDYGEQSVTFADRSENETQKSINLTTYATAFCAAGKISEAKKLFREAEDLQKILDPAFPYLYSLRGVNFCDFLLSMGEYQVVLQRALTTVKNAERNNLLVDIALDKLSLGTALLRKFLDRRSFNSTVISSEDFQEAESYFRQAVDGLREAEQEELLARALLARVTLFRHQEIFPKAWADLTEAYEISTFGQMRLYRTDYHLEAARLIQTQLAQQRELVNIIEDGLEQKLSTTEAAELFKTHVNEAADLVQETGYHRRDEELAILKESTLYVSAAINGGTTSGF